MMGDGNAGTNQFLSLYAMTRCTAWTLYDPEFSVTTVHLAPTSGADFHFPGAVWHQVRRVS